MHTWFCTHNVSVHKSYNVKYKFDKYIWSSYNTTFEIQS
jgi:hypothetical protein